MLTLLFLPWNTQYYLLIIYYSGQPGIQVVNQMACPNELSVRLPFWEIRESEPREFEPWSSQTNGLNIDTCRYLAWRLTSLG